MKIRNAGIFALLVLLPITLYGQRITGSIEGRISDASEAVLPGVEITVTSDATGQVRTGLTNETGRYNFPLLPSGTYTVQTAFPGFRTEIRSGVQVQVDRNARIDFELQVGQVTETIEVTADAPLIETDTSALGQVIDTQRVTELPLNGRDFLQLAVLTPGVQPVVEGSNLEGQQGSMHANGAREEFNNFLLDGVDNNDIANAQLIIVPGIDSVQEFKVQTSSFSAEFGRAAGGLINVSTKSGTNAYHGSAFEFVRNDIFDARNYFNPKGTPKRPFRRNQYGGTIGGPIIRDTAFFFFSFDATSIRQAQSGTGKVPETAFRSGDFSSLVDSDGKPLSLMDPTTGHPFPGNIIPASRFSQIGQNMVDLYPAENVPGAAANFNGAYNLKSDTENWTGRFDTSWGDSDSLFVRYSIWDQDRLEPFRSGATLPNYGTFLDTLSQAGTFNQTHIFSPNLVNEFRLGFTRIKGGLIAEARDQGIEKQLGICCVLVVEEPDFRDDLKGPPLVRLLGYNSAAGSAAPHIRWDNHTSFTNNLSYTTGNHQMKFGFEYRRTAMNLFLIVFPAGDFRFDGRYTGNSVGDTLLGLPNITIRNQGDIVNYERSTHFSGYFQDDWDVTDRLTLNLGMRWETQTAGYDKHDRKASYQPDRQLAVKLGDSGFQPDIQPIVDTFPGFAVADGSLSRGGYAMDFNNFGPRMGFAYDVAGDGRTVLRGGGGVFYVPVLANKTHSYKRGFPYVITQTIGADDDTRTPEMTLEDPFPDDLVVGASSFTVRGVNPKLRTSYMMQWNLNVQRELTNSTVLEIGYAGSKGNKLTRTRNVNQAIAGSDLGQGTDISGWAPTAARRPDSRFGNIGWLEDSASSNYHSFQESIDRRFANGVSFLQAYTWSKSIDDNSGSSGLGGGASPMDNTRLFLERGPSIFDRTHRLTFAGTWLLPLGEGMDGAAGALARGWQLNTIYTYSSGQPFTPGLSGDNSRTGVGQDRPNLLGDSKAGGGDASEWFNTSAFSTPPTGTIGNAGRGALRGPPTNQLDLAVYKNFAVGENADAIQFRAEFFNATNHPQWRIPNRIQNSSTFGVISRARDNRQIQLAIKLSF
jgi:hypothetical protein